jgi:membrane associated rhomboid family serine protease
MAPIVADVQSGGVAYLARISGIVFGAVTARLFEEPASEKQTYADDLYDP